MIRAAIAKGRLFDETRNRLQASGWWDEGVTLRERGLVHRVSDRLEILVTRAMDVPVYVSRGAADIGLCGLDTILEADVDLVELADLELGKCRMCLCGPKGQSHAVSDIRVVATKFPRMTRALLREQGFSVETVKLHGALEVAPQVGVADAIVDLVETGRTLVENDLEEWQELLRVSARLFTTEASLVTRQPDLNEFAQAMCSTVSEA